MDAFASFDERRSPRVAAELGIEFPDRPAVEIDEDELLVVPRGVEHRPAAEAEADTMLFEPTEARNTGCVEDERTLTDLERVERCDSTARRLVAG